MKWLRTMVIFNQGNIIDTESWDELHTSYISCIKKIDFPEGSGSLTLRMKEKKPNGQWDRNGVVYLKNRFLHYMTTDENWEAEKDFGFNEQNIPPNLTLYPSRDIYREPIVSKFGEFDFVSRHQASDTKIAIEWETGNISSSHRSINKLAIALKSGVIQIGVLIVPSRDLYEHLTDRIGNISELSGYLSMWHGLGPSVKIGLLAITVVEHDALTKSGSYLPVGKDGRAKEGKSKRH